MTTTSIGPAKSWRLIHDGKAVFMLSETDGITATIHTAFEATTLTDCLREVSRLGLPVPHEYADQAITPAIPQSVTMRQARLALHAAGLLPTVVAAVANASEAVKIEWEFAATVERTWPTLIALQAALGLTDAQIDALFVAGAAL